MKYVTYIILLIAIMSFSDAKQENFIIVIDAGHGGKDSGAVGYYGLQEKKITLNMALSVKTLINAYDKSITVILTRKTDRFISLRKRTEISNLFKPDLFLSIHCDANTKKSIKGASVYLQKNIKSRNYLKKNYENSVRFGMILQTILKEDLKIKQRKLLFNNYQVLRETLRYSPSVLVETGYISNKQDADYYKSNGQKAISYAILKAVLEYKKIKT